MPLSMRYVCRLVWQPTVLLLELALQVVLALLLLPAAIFSPHFVFRISHTAPERAQAICKSWQAGKQRAQQAHHLAI